MRTIKIRCGHGVEEVYGDLATPWKDKNGRQIYAGDTIVNERGDKFKVVFDPYTMWLLDNEECGYQNRAHVWKEEIAGCEIVDPKPEAPITEGKLFDRSKHTVVKIPASCHLTSSEHDGHGTVMAHDGNGKSYVIAEYEIEAPANKCADCPLMRDPSNITDDKWSER